MATRWSIDVIGGRRNEFTWYNKYYGCPRYIHTQGEQDMIFLLIWFQVVEGQGVRYHHLSTHTNLTLCKSELQIASVLVNDKTETIECVGVKVDD